MGALPYNRLRRLFRSRDGVAVVVVISIVSIGLLMALAYLFGMQFEARSARIFMHTIKARYAAESAANYAMALLKSDSNLGVDGIDDTFIRDFTGSSVDVDGDGVKDARWIYLGDDVRAAVLVQDNSGKVNLNCPVFDTSRAFSYLISRGELSRRYAEVAGELVAFLKGDDRGWGQAYKDDNGNNFLFEHDGLDNNKDGMVDELREGVDEVEEFSYPFLRGDDRALLTIDMINRFVPDISPQDSRTLMRYFTASSGGSDLDANGMPKVNLNYLSTIDLAGELLKAGVSSAWQKAANIRDFCDRDFRRSSLFAKSYVYKAYRSEDAPSWRQFGTVFINGTASGEWEYWEWKGVAPGQYYCYIYGSQDGQYIGDVRVNGATRLNVHSGDALSGSTVYVDSDGILRVEIRFPKDSQEKRAYFSHIELVPSSGGDASDRPVYGIEGIRIRAVYSNPKISLSAGDATLVSAGSWIADSGGYRNSDAGSGKSGEGIWEFSDLPKGNFYVQVLGRSEEDVVGDVDVGWTSENHMHSHTWLGFPVTIYDGSLRVKIQNNEADGTVCWFSGIVLSQEPDTEFIEICNITEEDVDVGGWSVDIQDKEGFPLFIPQGTIIEAGSCRILAMDAFDSCDGVMNNNISVEDVFTDVSPADMVSLDISFPLEAGLDMIPSSGVLMLKDSEGGIVDAVDLTSPKSFSFLLRDLYDNQDNSGNGNFDNWMREDDIGDYLPGGRIDSEIEGKFFNRPVVSFGELFNISDGRGGFLSKEDVSLIMSRLVVWGLDLFPFGNHHSGWSEQSGFLESSTQGEICTLFWDGSDGIRQGYYRLVLEAGPNQAIEVSFFSDGKWEPFSTPIWSDSSGYIDLNWIYVKDNELKLRIRNATPFGKCRLYCLHLSPQQDLQCKVNLNTALKPTLLAVGFSPSSANALLSGRPYGNEFLGIGKIVNFLPESELGLARFLTTNSNAYTIIAVGQSMKANKVLAEKKLWIGTRRK